jgi:glycosyltransferase involved in cell wall biosynthesis
VRQAPAGNFYGAYGQVYRQLNQTLDRIEPDIVLCHFGHIALCVDPVVRAHGVAMVPHFHGLDLSASLRNRWYRWSLQRTLPAWDHMIVVGSHQRRWLRDQGVPRERIHLLPCGVPTEQYEPAVRRKEERLQVVAVSRLVRWKGLDYSLKAFAELKKTHPAARFVIVGEGPEQPALQNLARSLQIDDAVQFAGALSPQQVQQQMQHSDIFVQHSLTDPTGWVEGFGVSIAEAAATALPVVVTDCGGITDQVVHGETGFVVPQRDSAQMAKALRQLADDPARRQQLGEAEHTRVREHFDTTQQVRRLEAVLLHAR